MTAARVQLQSLRERTLRFSNARLLPLLFGVEDANLLRLEKRLGVRIEGNGQQLCVRGSEPAVRKAVATLQSLYRSLEQGRKISELDIDLAMDDHTNSSENPPYAIESISLPKRKIFARNAAQSVYIRALNQRMLTFGVGPAGTGKTWLAAATGASALLRGEVLQLILCRPALEAGERLGFLPGDLNQKVDPYLRPLLDVLHVILPASGLAKRLQNGSIAAMPLAFMRGRSLSRAFVILDEAQNATPGQMKMFLTRAGEETRVVVTGDLSQSDLPPSTRNGLEDVLQRVKDMPEIAIVRFSEADVVRSFLTRRILAAYSGSSGRMKRSADRGVSHA